MGEDNFDDYIEHERQKIQDIPSYTRCDRCNAEIYNGEEYFVFEGDTLCEECFDDVQADEKIDASRIAGEDIDE